MSSLPGNEPLPLVLPQEPSGGRRLGQEAQHHNPQHDGREAFQHEEPLQARQAPNASSVSKPLQAALQAHKPTATSVLLNLEKFVCKAHRHPGRSIGSAANPLIRQAFLQCAQQLWLGR